MDRYILIIGNEIPPQTEQYHFVNYLNSLPLNDELGYANVSAEIEPLAKWRSTFFALITVPKFTSRNLSSTWYEVSEHVEPESIFKENSSSDTSSLVDFDGNESRSISHVIHELADQLPCYGTYYLDVLLSCNLLENANAREHICFIGALQRLQNWHRALLVIIPGDKQPKNSIQQWCKIIKAQMYSNDSMASTPLLWRGEIEVCSKENPQQWELRLCPHEVKDSRLLKNALEIEDKHELYGNHSWKLSTSLTMEILDECALSSIPLHMFSLPVMQLYPCNGNNINASSRHLLEYLTSKSDATLILRLKFQKFTESAMFSNTYTTEKWKKAVMSGNINRPECKLTSPTGHFMFAAVKQQCEDPSVTVYFLQSRSVNTNFLCDIMKTSNIPVHLGPSETIIKKYMREFFHISHLNCSTLQNYMGAMKKVSLEVLLDWIGHVKSSNHSDESILTVKDVAVIFNKIIQLIFSKVKSQGVISTQNCEEFPVSEQSIDPLDWPERLYLLHQQIETDKNSKYESPETLSGIAPPFILNNATIISAKDIGKYFKETGECNDAENLEMVQSKSGAFYLSHSLKHILQTQWPDIINYKFHDIYYNTDTNAENEANDNKVKKDYLVHETASSCCNQQIVPHYTILPKKLSSSSSISKKRAKKLDSAGTKLGKQSTDYGSCSSKSLLSKDECNNLKQPKCGRNKPLHPRKSSRKNSSNSAQSQAKKVELLRKNSYTVIQDDLSEHHKKKLREAVVFALEMHKITFEDDLFKPCARKLFAVCKPFVKDVIGKGNTSSQLKRIAQAHSKQVVDFELEKSL